MATNNDDDELDRWLDVLPADTRAAILDSVEGEGESPQIVHIPPRTRSPNPSPNRTRSAGTLWCPAFDRLAGGHLHGDRQDGGRHGVDLLADWCEREVRVVTVTQQIDLSGAIGRMVASVLFGLAEIESEYRRERRAAGIAVAKKRGLPRPAAWHDEGPAASGPGTPGPWTHGPGNRHGAEGQPADRLPVPG